MKHPEIRILVVAWLAVILTTLPAEGGKRLPVRSKSENPYREQWAIIIGTNYTGRDDARAEGVSELKNAESDAEAVAATLIEYYGYKRDNVKVLIGEHANRSSIELLFGELFLNNPEIVTERDSVFVFFAGHGDARTANDHTRAVIWPHDVKVADGQGVVGNTLKLVSLIDDLKSCVAVHKLLILDSCHSGAVFKVGGLSRSATRYRFDPELFRQDVFLAMSSARSFQTAADGDDHSPFTAALLEALHGGIVPSCFGASALHSRVAEKVHESSRQNPSGGTITGEGEFYFFRDKEPSGAAQFAEILNRYKADFATDEPMQLPRGNLGLSGATTGLPAVETAESTLRQTLPWIVVGTTLLIVFGAILWYRQRVLTAASITSLSTVADEPQAPLSRLPATPVATAPEGVMDKITLSVVGSEVETICVFGAQTDVGRSAECGFSFRHGARQASSRHARLRYVPAEKQYLIEDLDSRNGTYVGGKKVYQREVVLESGAQIQFGQSVFLDFDQLENEGGCVARLVRRNKQGDELSRCFLIPGTKLALRRVFDNQADGCESDSAVIFDEDKGFHVGKTDGDPLSVPTLCDGDKISFGASTIEVRLPR
jgi:hypothetical protein